MEEYSRTRSQVMADFKQNIEGPYGALRFRAGGLISEDKAMQVYQACMELKESDRVFTSRREFKMAIQSRLRDQPYGFNIAMIVLVLKLITLFLDLWFVFDSKVRMMAMR